MEAKITTDGKKIIADIPYAGGRGPVWAKKVPGHRPLWDKTGEKDKFLGWTYPLTMATCRSFREVFRDELRVSNDLAAWAAAEIARENQMEDMRAGKGIELDRVLKLCPDLYVALASRSYQIAGAGFLLTGGQVILGDEPGLGKTLQTLAALVQSDSQRVLVSCPKTATYSVWVRETARWAPHIKTFRAQGSHAEREAVMVEFEAAFGPKMLIINTEMIRAKRIEVCPDAPGGDVDLCPAIWTGQQDHKHQYNSEPDWPFLFLQQWDAIVLDESHNLLASTANIQSKRITQGRTGAVHLRKQLREGGLAIALSGTPFRSKLPKSWGTLNWLRPDVFGSYWRFAETYFDVNSDGWGKVVSPEPKDQAVFDRAIRPYYLVRTKAEAAPDLPPITYAGTPPESNPDGLAGIWLEMEGKQAKAYRDMASDATARVEGGTVMANGVLAEITRLRQFASGYGHLNAARTMLPEMPSNKIDWILEFLREREGNAGKVVIASSFTEMVELVAETIRKELKEEVLTLTGKTSDSARRVLVERFGNMDDPCRVVVLNRKAGGESITLDAADDMIIIDQPWISDEDEQLESRIHRVSRIHAVTVYRLLSKGTVDEWMAGITDEQRNLMVASHPRELTQLLEDLAK